MRVGLLNASLGALLVALLEAGSVLVVHNGPKERGLLRTIQSVFHSYSLTLLELENNYYHCAESGVVHVGHHDLVIYLMEGEFTRCRFPHHLPAIQVYTHHQHFIIHYPGGGSSDRLYLSEGSLVPMLEYARIRAESRMNAWSTYRLWNLHSLMSVIVGLASCYVFMRYVKEWLFMDWFPSSKYGCHEKQMLAVNSNMFRSHMSKLIDFMVEYVHNPQKYRVCPNADPGFIYKGMPTEAPEKPQEFDSVLQDVSKIIMPGMLHWQHPRFHGFFATGFSYADVLGHSLVSALGCQHFSWDSGPAMTELEIVIMNWMANALDLPKAFHYDLENAQASKGGGCLQNSASDAILCAVLTARRLALVRNLVKKYGKGYEKLPRAEKNKASFDVLSRMVCYFSDQAHSSIEKACVLAAVQARAVRADPKTFVMTADSLEAAIQRDLAEGLIPFHLHITVGTTNLGLCENVRELARVAKRHKMWVHVDAAYAGSFCILPEKRVIFDGIELVDSLEVNMHKQLLMTAAATLFWCRRQKEIIRTFTIEPEYLKRKKDKIGVHDFRHWGINLTRRAVAVPIWFTLRMYGLENIRSYLRRLISHRKLVTDLLERDSRFVIVGIPSLTVVAFRLNVNDRENGNNLTKSLCEYINSSGRLYFTYCSPLGISTIRFVVTHQLSTEEDIVESYNILTELTDKFLEKNEVYNDCRRVCHASTPVRGSADHLYPDVDSDSSYSVISSPYSSFKSSSHKSAMVSPSFVQTQPQFVTVD